jgi:hypothetical protein
MEYEWVVRARVDAVSGTSVLHCLSQSQGSLLREAGGSGSDGSVSLCIRSSRGRIDKERTTQDDAAAERQFLHRWV